MVEPSSPDAQTEKKSCQCVTKICNFITGSLETGFYRLGKAVGRSPWITILISLIVCGGCLTGMIKFSQESRGDKLWTPEDSTAQKHKLWVDENFPTEVRVSIVLLVAGDVLSPTILKEALMIHNKVKELDNGTDKAWENICFRLGPVCLTSGLLELWSFDDAVINQLTKDDILRKVNQPNIISPVTKKKFVLSQYLGGIERNATNHIVKAEATSMSYGIKFNPVLNERAGRLEDTLTESWETDFNKLMDSFDLSVELFYYSRVKYREDAGGSIQGDIQLLSIGYMLIIAYVAIMLGKFTRLNIKAWLALVGVICIGLAIGVSFGLASAFGSFYGPVHSILPFLLLGIGVDDMFVIVQAWSNLPPDLVKNRGIPEGIGLALKHAGCSITITSLTDFLAFMIGASTILPALKSFCIFAGIGILADFALQATLFTAFLAIDARRQGKRRDGCCCCIKLRDDYSESTCGKRNILQELIEKYITRAMLSLPGKIVVVVITGTLFGVNLYGTLMLRQYFDRAWFLPPESMGYKYTVTNSKYFPVDGAPANIYTGKFDYYENQGKLHQLHDAVVRDKKYVVSSSVNSWYEEYIKWASSNKPGQYFDQSSTPWKINSKINFYSWLVEFLRGPGVSYLKDIRVTNVSGQLPTITASRFSLRHKDMDSTQREVKAMDNMRDKIEEVFSDDLAFPYSRFYLAWETNKVISKELFRNMGLALMAVFIVTLVVLANLWACLMVFTCVGFTLVSITGTMHFWGLTIDTVTTIILVLAVGLSVDYASHIAHTFMILPGTRYDRARATMRDIGPAVWNGGFSTFLAIVLLAFSNSYVFKTFFKVFFCVVLYGLFHGMCYLPVLLSAIGPSAYESAQAHDNKQGRLSPVHPAGLPGDNTSYELAVANRKKTPVRNGRHSAVNNVQNGGYPVHSETNNTQNGGYSIPPTDYEEVDVSAVPTSPRYVSSQENQGFRSSIGADLDKA